MENNDTLMHDITVMDEYETKEFADKLDIVISELDDISDSITYLGPYSGLNAHIITQINNISFDIETLKDDILNHKLVIKKPKPFKKENYYMLNVFRGRNITETMYVKTDVKLMKRGQVIPTKEDEDEFLNELIKRKLIKKRVANLVSEIHAIDKQTYEEYVKIFADEENTEN